ncbi:Gfo/Idh/MocA family protein [Salinicola tamaricis]|uniref:Gfo/Idh/MocA family protein n=1 Tax=Salinicola tamaricis TaxID=1771309 RepID=UPI000D0A195B|nr:Gfo/Idh/MocA family oxidoreductase [Salinicola tamaricis]
MSCLKLGVVGGGLNSAVGYAHFVAAHLDGLWEFYAGVFSRDHEVNLASAARYRVPNDRVFSNVEELLKKEGSRLDAVLILTPTPVHEDAVLKCLDAGLPVVCEKSLTVSSEKARKIKSVSEASGGFLAVIYNYSGYPMAREMRSLVKSGSLGEIVNVRAEMPQEGFLREPSDKKGRGPQGWRLCDGSAPTLYLDLAIHLHHLIYYVTGLSPAAVIADQESCGRYDVIDDAQCLCRYDNGSQGHLWFSKSALGFRNGLKLQVFGTLGSVEWMQCKPEELTISYANGQRMTVDNASGVSVAANERYMRFKAGHPAGFIEALSNLYQDIYSDLLYYREHGAQSSEEVFGAKLSVSGLKFIEAMVASVKSRRWEEVERE